MTEETSGPDGAFKKNPALERALPASNPKTASTKPSSEIDDAALSDAHIVEETITKPHIVTAPPTSAPQPQQSDAAAPPALPKTSAPAMVALPPMPKALSANPAPPKPVSLVPPPAPVSPPPPPPTPTLTPTHAVSPAENKSDEKSGIAQILKDIKLPERRDVVSSGTPSKKYEVKTFDTVLGADVKVKQEKTRSESPPQVSTTAAETESATSPKPEISVDTAGPEDRVVRQATPLASVHTLKDDLQHVVRDQKISLVRAVSLEEARKHKPASMDVGASPAQMQRSRRVFAILFSVFLLVILGGGALFGVYSVERARSAPPASLSTSSILFAENSVAFPLDGRSAGALKQLLAQARTTSRGTLGSITQIVPTLSTTADDGTVSPRRATFIEFMHAVGVLLPDDLARSLSSEYFFGVHTVDQNAPVIVVPIVSYNHAFAAMLEWEPTLNAGLAPIFTLVPMQTLDAAGFPAIRSFKDLVMRNYDVRALQDDAGKTIMYYSFPTQNILIIAESPYTFTEILSRLQAQRRL